MEDLPKTNSVEQSGVSDKETKEDTRKKRSTGFLQSYLRAFYPDALKQHKTEEDDEEEGSKKKSFLERFVDRIKPRTHKLFEDNVEVEPVTETEAVESPEKLPEEPKPRTEAMAAVLGDMPEADMPSSEAAVMPEPQTAEPMEATTIIDHTT